MDAMQLLREMHMLSNAPECVINQGIRDAAGCSLSGCAAACPSSLCRQLFTTEHTKYTEALVQATYQLNPRQVETCTSALVLTNLT
eukprot:scaffold83588_cov20-Tisochrysis_lutea.AAC.1